MIERVGIVYVQDSVVVEVFYFFEVGNRISDLVGCNLSIFGSRPAVIFSNKHGDGNPFDVLDRNWWNFAIITVLVNVVILGTIIVQLKFRLLQKLQVVQQQLRRSRLVGDGVHDLLETSIAVKNWANALLQSGPLLANE